MNDLVSKYKAETGLKRKDIDLNLIVNDKGEISVDKTYLEDSELKNIGMADRFINAVNIGFDREDTLTIIDHNYVKWLEMKLM